MQDHPGLAGAAAAAGDHPCPAAVVEVVGRPSAAVVEVEVGHSCPATVVVAVVVVVALGAGLQTQRARARAVVVAAAGHSRRARVVQGLWEAGRPAMVAVAVAVARMPRETREEAEEAAGVPT